MANTTASMPGSTSSLAGSAESCSPAQAQSAAPSRAFAHCPGPPTAERPRRASELTVCGATSGPAALALAAWFSRVHSQCRCMCAALRLGAPTALRAGACDPVACVLRVRPQTFLSLRYHVLARVPCARHSAQARRLTHCDEIAEIRRRGTGLAGVRVHLKTLIDFRSAPGRPRAWPARFGRRAASSSPATAPVAHAVREARRSRSPATPKICCRTKR